jgi:hypothetical protein
MSRRESLFEVECDNAMVHSFLTKFPKDADIELIISHAHKLYMDYPPESLQKLSQTLLDEKYAVFLLDRMFSKVSISNYNLSSLIAHV